MTLKNNLYKITAHSEVGLGAHTYTIRLNPECFIYKAHFPDMPVTPGVCTMQTAVELLEDATATPLEIKKLKNVKFLSVMSPAQSTEVIYKITKIDTDSTTGDLSAQIAVEQSGETKAKISLTCRKK